MSNTARNTKIDLFKGIAALGIVAIHTAFWSGQLYTPQWFWNLTLYLDVPFFYYLSGWGASHTKADIVKASKSLGKIWLKWIFFVSILVAFCEFSKSFYVTFEGCADIRELVNCFMFNVSIPGFPVVAGSIWFMEIYFLVIIGNTLITMIIEYSHKREEYKRIYCILLGTAFLWVYFGRYFLGLEGDRFLFYSFFWMLGYNRFGKAKNLQYFIVYMIIIWMGIIGTSYLQGLPLYEVATAKFPPSPKYAFVSLNIIFLVMYFEDKVKKCNKILVHIGQNAIFYYFGQGIGSSLIYFYVRDVNIEHWFVKWFIAFVINVVCTALIAEVLAILYYFTSQVVNQSIRKLQEASKSK